MGLVNSTLFMKPSTDNVLFATAVTTCKKCAKQKYYNLNADAKYMNEIKWAHLASRQQRVSWGHTKNRIDSS